MTRWVALLAALLMTGGCEPPPAAPAGTQSAERIVTLAPHLSELVFAAGAGERLVGVSAYSDFPAAVAELPVVGDAFTVDQEQLALLAPDLLLAWRSGTPAHVIEELRNAGYRVEAIETQSLEDIAAAIRRIGEIADAQSQSTQVAAEFEAQLHLLRQRYASKAPLSVFYQVSMRPLFTINGGHYIGEIFALCGGQNIFAELGDLAPAVTVESVVERNPEAIFATSIDGDEPFSDWRRWPHLRANRYNNHFRVNADEIGRPSLRLVSAAAQICTHLETARSNRGVNTAQE